MALTLLAAIAVLTWLYLLFGRGFFWYVPKNLLRPPSHAVFLKRVVVIIPARNEAQVIGAALRSLCEQQLPELLKIVLVDDGSTDGTAEAARSCARNAQREHDLVIIPGQPVPPGWTGKLWALSQGVAYAEQFAPDYFLFTDADILHGPQSIADLIAIAESRNCDLVSYMVKLECQTFAERALIPAFVFFFFKLYPPAWIAHPRYRTAGAAGGCVLIKTQALERIGGFSSIRAEVIDDCALARRVKRSGGRILMGLTEETRSIRTYRSFAEIGRMISRTAFFQLRHSLLLLIASLIALSLTYLAPPALIFSGNVSAAMLGLAAWLIMAFAYWPMVRFYRLSPLWSFALPLIALFYMGATVHSACSYWLGRGGVWKGRIQDARQPG